MYFKAYTSFNIPKISNNPQTIYLNGSSKNNKIKPMVYFRNDYLTVDQFLNKYFYNKDIKDKKKFPENSMGNINNDNLRDKILKELNMPKSNTLTKIIDLMDEDDIICIYIFLHNKKKNIKIHDIFKNLSNKKYYYYSITKSNNNKEKYEKKLKTHFSLCSKPTKSKKTSKETECINNFDNKFIYNNNYIIKLSKK